MTKKQIREVRSQLAREAAMSRWRCTYKADRVRFAKAVRAGKRPPPVRKWRKRKKRAAISASATTD